MKPMISHVVSGPEGVTTYFLEDYPEELAEENEIVSQDPEFPENTVSICVIPYGEISGRQSRQTVTCLLQ